MGGLWDRVGRGLGSQGNPEGESVTDEKTEVSEKNAHIGIPPQTQSYENTGHNQIPSLAAKGKKDKGNGSEKLLGGIPRGGLPLQKAEGRPEE